MDEKELYDVFPESSKPGSDTSKIKPHLIMMMAEGSKPFTEDEWKETLVEHQKFLDSGGEGGHWRTLLIKDSGLTVGVYEGPEGAEGKQAWIPNSNLQEINLNNIRLPFANLLGTLCKDQDLSGSDLSMSLLIDSVYERSTFENAILIGTDFSRSNMRNCNFRNADLRDADFENCDLTGSDFTGAKLEDSHFPGAKLKNVKR